MCIVWPPSFAFNQTGTSLFLKAPGTFSLLLFVDFVFHEGYAVSGYDVMTIQTRLWVGVEEVGAMGGWVGCHDPLHPGTTFDEKPFHIFP